MANSPRHTLLLAAFVCCMLNASSAAPLRTSAGGGGLKPAPAIEEPADAAVLRRITPGEGAALSKTAHQLESSGAEAAAKLPAATAGKSDDESFSSSSKTVKAASVSSLGQSGGSPLPAVARSSADAAKLDGPAAAAFCARPDFNSSTCGWASPAEVAATTNAQTPYMYTHMFSKLSPRLPATLEAPAGTSDKVVWASKVVSLACKGDFKVRHVFKYLALPKVNATEKPPSAQARTQSTATGVAAEEGKYVRCALQLPAGPGSEEERALRAKEGPCYLCKDNAGSLPNCPIEIGKWYSTTETFSTDGCAFDQSKGYAALEIGVKVPNGARMRLAGFEACSEMPCFDAAYEAAKRKSAIDCDTAKCA